MMRTRSTWSRILLAVAALAIVAAACGDSDPEPASSPTAPVVADDPASLPPNPNADVDPTAPIAGACLEGEPDCIDTGVITDEPLDLPPPSDEPVAPSGMLVGGGLTVTDALSTDATGVIAVQGFLFVVDGEARLCELLAESFPPQCGGADLPVTNYEEVLGVPTQEAQGVTWTDELVTFLGEIVDGTLVVDPLVAQ